MDEIEPCVGCGRKYGHLTDCPIEAAVVTFRQMISYNFPYVKNISVEICPAHAPQDYIFIEGGKARRDGRR